MPKPPRSVIAPGAIHPDIADMAVPLGDVHPHPKNARVGDVAALVESLRANGQYKPILVSVKTKNIVAGNHTWKAAEALGWETIAVDWRKLTAGEELRILAVDNRASDKATYDDRALAELLEELAAAPTGLDGSLYSSADLDELLRSLEAPAKVGREGETPSLPAKPKSKVGDVYDLGPHVLVVGDARDADAYTHGPTQFELCVTDPPYGVDYEGRTDDKLTIIGDQARSWDDYHRFIYEMLVAVRPKIKGAMYMFHAALQTVPILSAWADAGYHHSSTIVWHKTQFVMGRSDYHWQWEPIIYGWPEGESHFWIGARNQGNVWSHVRPKASRLHPTMKPIGLLEQAISNSSQVGSWVVDPYGGSGSTLIAADNLDRRCYMIELDPHYADVIIARWKSLEPSNTATKR